MPEVFVIDGVEAQEPLAKIFSGAINCARSHHAHRELVNTTSRFRTRLRSTCFPDSLQRATQKSVLKAFEQYGNES